MSLFGLFERRGVQNPAVPLTSSNLLEYLGGVPQDSGVAVSETSSLHMPAVWRAVSVISCVSASLPLHSYRVGTRERTTSRLLANPHPELTAYELWRLSYVHRVLWGDSFLQKVRNGAGQVLELWPVRPDRVRVDRVRPSDGLPGGKLFTVTDDQGEQHDLTSRDILHIPGLGYDGTTGCSPIRAAAQGIGLAVAAEKSAARLFGSGNMVSGILKTEQKLHPDQAEALKSRWKAKVSGVQNAHEIAVLDAGASFEPVTMPYKDAQFLESRQFQISEIARMFGVPLFLLMETQKSTCLPADAQVFTINGPRRIADVRVGDRVWSLDWSSKTFRLARVWRSEKTGCDPILRIKTRARVLRANAQHRVLVRRKYPAPRQGYGGYRAVEWRNEWIEAGDVRLGDYLVALNGLPDGHSAEAPNGRLLTPGFMAFAGLMLGDGTVNKGSVSVARHAEAPYMDFYREVMQREFYRLTTGGARLASDRERRPITLREYDRCTIFSSVSAAAELRELGLSGTAATKRVPEWVFSLTPDLIGEFLGGYIDSDGAVNTRGWVTFSSCNPQLLEDIRHLCMAIGVPVGTVRRYRQAGECVVGGHTVTRGDMFQLFAYDVRSNRKMTPHHPEKRRRIWDAPASEKVNVWSPDYRGRGPVGSRPGETFGIDGGALQLVKEIEVESAEDVYDLGVEGTHSFIADGLIVHNSWGTGLEQQAQGFVTFDLGPTWLTPTEQRVSKELLPPGIEAKYAVQGLLRGDSRARAEFYRTLREIGALSANEIRDLEDRPPVDGGDSYLQPLNLAPLGSTTATTDLTEGEDEDADADDE